MPDTSPARVLEAALANFRGELTVADASTRSGLPLRDAEDALRVLAADYAGHLAATSKGELIYSFPRGLVKPPETRLSRRVGRALLKVASGVVRFVVRAWVSVVLVGYALVFLAVLVALAFRGGDDRDSPWEGVGVVLRMIAEALFWTFHPFSPLALRAGPSSGIGFARHRRVPFYERVNRFVFGPPSAKIDPREREREILAEIRRHRGRIAPGDVMRVTGASREEAERLLLRLVVDYQGDIVVSEAGVITYTFVDLRTTSDRADRTDRAGVPAPVWHRPVALPPLTGNGAGSNLLFAVINGFNLVASGFVLANDLTLERLTAIVTRVAAADPTLAAFPLPAVDGIPLALGAVPFAFSLALFAFPLLRLVRRRGEAQGVARQNGWRGVLRQVLGHSPAKVEYGRDELGRAWEAASGRAAAESELDAAVRDLGGTVVLRDDGALVYQFDVIGRELEELLAQRSAAGDEEAIAGRVVFSSADEGSGIREGSRRTPMAESVPERGESPVARSAAAPPAVVEGGGGTRPEKLLLEEHRDPVEFLDRLMAESERRRRD